MNIKLIAKSSKECDINLDSDKQIIHCCIMILMQNKIKLLN